MEKRLPVEFISRSQCLHWLLLILGFVFGLQRCSQPQNQNKEAYEIASPVYIALAEKSLDYLFNFEWDAFASMLTDEVVYELPDGKEIIGKTALFNHWRNYQNTSGITSMKIVNANYLPIDVHLKPKGNDMMGVKVLADFTNVMIYKDKKIVLKMNFNIHFNKGKLIDRIVTIYDSKKMQPDILNPI